jgi:GcrA cell cycle regulator
VSAWNDPKNIARLKQMWAKGLSASQIAARIGQGVTRSGVCGKVRRLGLADRKAQTSHVRKLKRSPNAFGLPPTAKKKPPTKLKGPPREGVYIEPTIEPEDIPTKTFDELERNDGCCRWRIDVETKGKPYGFCGREAVAGFSYCNRHARRHYSNWIEPQTRTETAKETVDA